MRTFVVALAMLFQGGIMLAQSATERAAGCKKTLTVDEFLLPEDAISAKRALAELRSALLSGDKQQVLAMVAFPADLSIDGYPTKFVDAKELAPQYGKVFTDYVVDSVRRQKPDKLVAGWEGVRLENRAVKFDRMDDGSFRISWIDPKGSPMPESIAEFEDNRLTCPPTVVEGRVTAFDWVSHVFSGVEGIFIDHLAVEVYRVIKGTVSEKNVRVDFWGLRNLPEYHLPQAAFEPGSTWRMYLRPSGLPPISQETCRAEVQEMISSVDESGKESSKDSAITVLDGTSPPTFAGLPCFETKRQFFTVRDAVPSN